MERREFLLTATAGAAAFAGLTRTLVAQGRGNPIDWTADPGKPASAPAGKLARISIMTLNFTPILKLPGNTPASPGSAANAAPNPNAPARTLDVLDIAQMYSDVYGVHNIEFQHNHIPSTELSYLKDLRAHVDKVKSRIQQINLEIEPMYVSAADPVLRLQCIDLTKRWIDFAVVLNCPKVMVNQGFPNQDNKGVMIETLKNVGDYGKSKGVKISMETRGGGGGRRGGAAAVEAAPAGPPPPPPAPAWVLLKEVIEKSGTYSNCDIGGVGAQNQQALHEAIQALMPTNSGQMHIKRNANWDLVTAIKFIESLGYKGLYTIEIGGHQGTRAAYQDILANI